MSEPWNEAAPEGRTAQYTALLEVMLSCDGAGAMLTGAAGSGKSVTARQVLRAMPGGTVVLAVHATPAMSDMSFGVLGGMVEGITPDSSAFAVVRLVIDHIEAQQAAAAEAAPGAAPGSSGRKPLLVVENAQDLDAASNYVLAQVALAGVARLLVIGREPSSTGRDLGALRDDGFLAGIVVNGLDVDHVHELCERRLEGPLSRSSASHLASLTGGNPRLLLAVLDWGKRSGFLRQRGGIWLVHAAEMTPDAVIADLVHALLEPLGESERRALEVLALAGDLPHAVLRALLGDDTINSLVEAGLLARRGRHERFIGHRVPLNAMVLADRVPHGRRADLLADVARALSTAGFADVISPQFMAWSVASGNTYGTEECVVAARQLNDAGHAERALQMLAAVGATGGVGSLPGSDPLAAAVELELARAAMHLDEGLMGAFDATAVLGATAAARPGVPHGAASDGTWEVALWRAYQRPAGALEAGEDVESGGNAVPTGPAGAAAGPERVRLAAALGAAPRTHGASGPAPSAGNRLGVAGGPAGTGSGPMRAADADPLAGTLALLLESSAERAAGRHERALVLDAEAAATAARCDPIPARLQVLLASHTAETLFYAGAYVRAEDYLEGVIAGSGAAPASVRGSAELLAGAIQIRQGRLRNGLRDVAGGIEELEGGDPECLAPLGLALAAYAAALLGESAASASYRVRHAGTTPAGPPERRLLADAYAAAARLAGGDADTGELLAMAAVARGDGLRSVEREILHLLARHAPHEGVHRLAAHIREPGHEPNGTTDAYAAARSEGNGTALLDIARAAAEQRAYLLGAEALVAAADVFEAGGAQRQCALARRELHALLKEVPDLDIALFSGAGAVTALTDREAEIVALAVTGRTNREIAQDLFLSQRTVEGHLYRTYAKLGIATRRELRAIGPSLRLNDTSRSTAWA